MTKATEGDPRRPAASPTVILSAVGLVVLAAVLYPGSKPSWSRQTDEVMSTINAELALGTRIERTEEVLLILEDRVKQLCLRHTTVTSGGTAGTTGKAVAAIPAAARSASS